MTAEMRRRLVTLLVGAMAMLTGLLVASLILQNRCLDAGGSWVAATRECDLPSDSLAQPSSGWAWMVGLAAGVVIAVVLWRAYAFFVVTAARRSGTQRRVP